MKKHIGRKKGYKFSKEHRRKLSEAHKGKKSHLGYKHSEETKLKMSRSMKGKMVGKKNPAWKGGVSKNKKYRRMMRKKWASENKDFKRFLNLKRLSIKKNAEGSHTFGEWELLKKQYGYTCPCCKKKEPFKGRIKYLTEDHIIPLFKGGSDYIENIQPLCKTCNSAKHTKIIKY